MRDSNNILCDRNFVKLFILHTIRNNKKRRKGPAQGQIQLSCI